MLLAEGVPDVHRKLVTCDLVILAVLMFLKALESIFPGAKPNLCVSWFTPHILDHRIAFHASETKRCVFLH